MTLTPVLLVPSDERWQRVLEVTLRLGGYEPALCRSLAEALQTDDDVPAGAPILLDLAREAGVADQDQLRALAAGGRRVVVILPEARAAEREAFTALGVRVVVRPYPPSELYEALAAA